MSESLDARTVSGIMQTDLVTVEASMTLREAIEVLRGAGVSGAPVLRGSRLVGVLSGTDILELEAMSPAPPEEPPAGPDWSEREVRPDEEEVENPSAFFFARREDADALWDRMTAPDGPEWDQLERHTVEEVMSRDVVTVSPGTPVTEAARLMLDHHIHRVLVVDGDDLVGVMSAFDFVRLVAEGPGNVR
jgi:CBS domain-containing protein